MKTETQIAEANILSFRKIKDAPTMGIDRYQFSISMKTHKKSCQRFLEFLEQLRIDKTWDVCWLQEDGVNIKDKIQDLEQAIKLYDEAGI